MMKFIWWPYLNYNMLTAVVIVFLIAAIHQCSDNYSSLQSDSFICNCWVFIFFLFQYTLKPSRLRHSPMFTCQQLMVSNNIKMFFNKITFLLEQATLLRLCCRHRRLSNRICRSQLPHPLLLPCPVHRVLHPKCLSMVLLQRPLAVPSAVHLD